MSSLTRAISLSIINSLLLVAVVGCGSGDTPDLAPVEGRVTLDGEPLANADVEFQPIGQGAPSYGYTDEDGRYHLQYSTNEYGAIPGDHVVRITTAGEIFNEQTYESSWSPEKVPARYNVNAHETPEMKKEVESGSNEINFELTSDGEIIQPEEAEAMGETY